MSFGPQNMTFPGWIVAQISAEIQSGKYKETVQEFMNARPDWQEGDSQQQSEQEEGQESR